MTVGHTPKRLSRPDRPRARYAPGARNLPARGFGRDQSGECLPVFPAPPPAKPAARTTGGRSGTGAPPTPPHRPPSTRQIFPTCADTDRAPAPNKGPGRTTPVAAQWTPTRPLFMIRSSGDLDRDITAASMRSVLQDRDQHQQPQNSLSVTTPHGVRQIHFHLSAVSLDQTSRTAVDMNGQETYQPGQCNSGTLQTMPRIHPHLTLPTASTARGRGGRRRGGAATRRSRGAVGSPTNDLAVDHGPRR